MHPAIYDASGKPTHWTDGTVELGHGVVLIRPEPALDPRDTGVYFHPHPLDPNHNHHHPLHVPPGLPSPTVVPPPGLVSEAPLVVLVSTVDSDQERVQARRARAAERLGGGPLVRERAQRADFGIRSMIDGLRSRPVL